VFSLGIPGADVYSGDGSGTDIRRLYTGGGGSVTNISFTSSAVLPFESPSRRFHMVSAPVTYGCLPAVTGGTLTRYSGYGFNATQVAPPGGIASLLVSQASSCSFTYTTLEVARSAGLISLSLRLTREGETISLFRQVHVSNVP